MGFTIAEKILSAHSGGAPVRAGDVVVAPNLGPWFYTPDFGAVELVFGGIR